MHAAEGALNGMAVPFEPARRGRPRVSIRRLTSAMNEVSRMKEVRVRWRRGQFDEHGHEVTGRLWHPDTPIHRELAERMVRAGEEVYGEGSHWIEEREAQFTDRATTAQAAGRAAHGRRVAPKRCASI